VANVHADTGLLGWLLTQGADPNLPTSNKMLPAHWAIVEGCDEALGLLLEYGLDIARTDWLVKLRNR
jgi:ankyrin repeat protein